jgi:Outer membrane lipoprotein carrier protein LolA-like
MRAATLLLLAWAVPAQADELLGNILKRLNEPAVVRAQFVQERLISDMTRPTLSHGRIAVSRRDGLLWRIESPVRLTLAFTPTAIIETGADGVRRLRAQGRDAETQIGRVLRGVLGADEQALLAAFAATASGSPERWTIRLVPRPREMARALRGIRLAGGRHLETIEVEETSGNLTTIRMRQFSVAERLEPDELEFFRTP